MYPPTQHSSYPLYGDLLEADLPPLPPSMTEIIDTFQKHGNGDRKLLLAILMAKQAEEERLAVILQSRMAMWEERARYLATDRRSRSSSSASAAAVPSPIPSSDTPSRSRHLPRINVALGSTDSYHDVDRHRGQIELPPPVQGWYGQETNAEAGPSSSSLRPTARPRATTNDGTDEDDGISPTSAMVGAENDSIGQRRRYSKSSSSHLSTIDELTTDIARRRSSSSSSRPGSPLPSRTSHHAHGRAPNDVVLVAQERDNESVVDVGPKRSRKDPSPKAPGLEMLLNAVQADHERQRGG